MRLLNADVPGTGSVLLSMRLRDLWHAFVRNDGLLCIVETIYHNLLGLAKLYWHTIDPASGQTLDSKHLHFWLPDDSPLDLVYHAASHRVAVLADEHSLAVLEADTLQEISTIHLCPRHRDQDPGALHAGSFAWSHDGRKLAATLPRYPHPRLASLHHDEHVSESSEVHVYDISSGECLQSILLASLAPSITWSSSLDMLLVHCDHERIPGPGADQDQGTWPGQPADGNTEIQATVRILEPAKQRAEFVQSQLDPGGNTVFAACHWSPCGTFLLTNHYYFHSTLRYCWEWCVQDPFNLEYIFKMPGHSRRMSWASRASVDGTGQVLIAFLAASRTVVTFSKVNGHWQASQSQLKGLTSCIDGSLAPSGDMLVAVGKPHQDPSRIQLIHHDPEAQQEHLIVNSFIFTCPDNTLQMAWAPLPAAWPPMYALVQKVPKHFFDVVNVVDAKAHRVLGSWTTSDISKQALGRSLRWAPKADSLQAVSWSPSGRHLAVFCKDRWTLVLSF